MIPYWPDAIDDGTKPSHEREYARLWVERPKVVFSNSLNETRWNTRVVPTGAFDEIARLRRESNSYVLCYGGSQFASAIHQQHLVDEYALYVHPNALGGGLPFFRERVDLRLADLRRFETGVLALRYATAG